MQGSAYLTGTMRSVILRSSLETVLGAFEGDSFRISAVSVDRIQREQFTKQIFQMMVNVDKSPFRLKMHTTKKGFLIFSVEIVQSMDIPSVLASNTVACGNFHVLFGVMTLQYLREKTEWRVQWLLTGPSVGR